MATAADVGDKLRALLDRQKRLERELDAMKAKLAAGATADLGAQASVVDGVRVLAARLENFDAKALREAVDRLKQQLGDAVVVLAGVSDGKAALVAGVSGSGGGSGKGRGAAGAHRRADGRQGRRPARTWRRAAANDGPGAASVRCRASTAWVAAATGCSQA